MANVHCAVTACKITSYNKPPGVSLYPCPSSHEMRNRWLMLLKNKCTMLDWAKSKICSRHFEKKYLDSQRKLKDNALPTVFPTPAPKLVKNAEYSAKSRIERLLSKQSQGELIIDIKSFMNRIKDPSSLDSYVNDDLRCKSDTPQEYQLLLLAKKQDYLITRLMDQVSQHKKHVSMLQKSLEEARSQKKEMEHNVDSLKYIVKSLHEKHATLEEQVEILTAVESR